MSRAVKSLIGIVVLVVVALGGLFAYVAMLDFNQYKPLIAAQVKAITGRELEIKGKIAPQFSLTPTLAVDGVTLANAAWGEKRPMVSVERFEAKLQLVPLITSLGKRIVIDRVLLKGAEIWLETDDKGGGNWKLDVAPPAGTPPASAATRGAVPDVVVMDVELENVKLSFKPAKATPTVLTLDKATMRGDTETSPRKLEAVGAFNKLKFEIGGQIGAVAQLLKGPFPLDLTLRMGDRAAFKLVGQLRQPMATKDYELRLTADMAEIGRIGELATEAGVAGVQIPALGPLKLDLQAADKAPNGRVSLTAVKLAIGTAETLLLAIDGAIRDPLGPSQTPVAAPGAVLKLVGNSPDLAKLAPKLGLGTALSGPLKIAGEISDLGVDKLALKGFSIDAAGSDLAGDGTLAFGGARPEITGAFKSKLLDLTKLTPQPGAAQASPAPPGDGRVIPDTPLPFAALDAANADLQLSIATLIAPAAKLQNVVLRAALKAGALALKPFTFEMDGGRFALETAMNAKDRTLTQKLEGRNLEIGRILQERHLNDWFRGGRATLDMNIQGKGETVRAIAASLGGDAALNMGAGEIGQALQRVLGQWLSAVSPALAQIQIGTSVRCAVYSVGFNNGIGTLRQGVVDTPFLTARTTGNFNLGNEQLALRTQAGPIGVHTSGTFSNPRTSIDPASTALGVLEGAAGTAGGVVGGVLGAVTGQGGGGGGSCGGSGGGQQQQRPGVPLPGGGSLPIPNPFRR